MMTLFKSMVRCRLEFSCLVKSPSLLSGIIYKNARITLAGVHQPHYGLQGTVLLGQIQIPRVDVTPNTTRMIPYQLSYMYGAIHKGRTQNLTVFWPPPFVRIFWPFKGKINSSVRIWKTPLPLWCGRSLWMTPVEDSPRCCSQRYLTSYEHIRLGTRCCVPPLPSNSPAYTKSTLDKSFAVTCRHGLVMTGSKLWNIIPRNVTCAASLESFKSRLPSHIMGTYPDQPPVSGYTTSNSNSLLVCNSWMPDKSSQEIQ